jgi:hypothetical protein
MLRLVSASRTLLVDRDSMVLGRDASADLVVDDPSVSRRHVRVTQSGDGWYVEDLNSANGTWLEGQRLSGTAWLANGQELRLGQVPFRVELPGGAEATRLVPQVPAPPSPLPPPYPATPYPPPAYPPAAAPAPARGGNTLTKVIAVVVLLYLGYSWAERQKSQKTAGTAAPAAGGATSLRVQSVKVDKEREGTGLKVITRSVVEGFKAREAQGGYQVSVAQDLETFAPDGSRIDQLSGQGINVLEKVMESAEGNTATFEYSFSVKQGARGTVTMKMRFRDQVGGGQASRDLKITIP